MIHDGIFHMLFYQIKVECITKYLIEQYCTVGFGKNYVIKKNTVPAWF